MPMLLIAGTYRILGAAPDGDSVRFYPDDPTQWDLIDGTHKVRRNSTGGAQLRLDGIDALETHYTASGAPTHQPWDYGRKAASNLLSWLGFSKVHRAESEKVTSAEPAEVPGYLFTRGADVYGRCVALAGRGAPPGPGGEPIRVTSARLRKTVNYHQLQRGVAYPTYYRKLYYDLRETMTAAVTKARQAGTGLWPLDETTLGAHLPKGLASIVDDVVIMPKLFRRLADYFGLNDNDPSLDGFAEYLAQRDDRIYVLPTGQWTGLDSIVKVAGQSLQLQYPPEQIVFEER
jgi:endonuclease YncB( thermonuclease family)